MKIKTIFVIVSAVAVVSSITLSAQAAVFTKNLSFGAQGDPAVSELQDFLTAKNLYSGPITGNFYFLTLTAVKAFQTQQGISPAAGYFGPVTRAAAEKIAGGEVSASNAEAVTETGSVPSSSTSSSAELQLEALLQQVALLQNQLAVQQQTSQTVQNLQTQVQQQGQTLHQIQQNTQPTPTSTPAQTALVPAGQYMVSNQFALDTNPTDMIAADHQGTQEKVFASSTQSFTISGRLIQYMTDPSVQNSPRDTWAPIMGEPLTITFAGTSATGITDNNGVATVSFTPVAATGTYPYSYSTQHYQLNDCGSVPGCGGTVTEY